MKYHGSEYNKQTAKKARLIGLKVIEENKQKRIDEYNENPKKCAHCDSSLTYKERNKKFCNSVCAGYFNNRHRSYKHHSEETKNKIKDSVDKFWSENNVELSFEQQLKQSGGGKNYCKIKITHCKICDKPFVQRSYGIRKTCSKSCQIISSTNRTYRNGSRKTIYFDNPNQGQVVLESNWELEIAELLCERNIKWIRPKPMKWIDSKNKEHVYYPDFYLTEQNIYLDPKNPYCMELDKEKMSIIENKVNILYGDIEIIKEYINTQV